MYVCGNAQFWYVQEQRRSMNFDIELSSNIAAESRNSLLLIHMNEDYGTFTAKTRSKILTASISTKMMMSSCLSAATESGRAEEMVENSAHLFFTTIGSTQIKA